MAKTKKSYLEAMRDKVMTDLESGASQGVEWVPTIGEHKIRLLPPTNPADMFYYSHSYHYLAFPEGGKYLYSKKFYNVNGAKTQCPVDLVVSEWYKEAEKTGDTALKAKAGSMKRKRNYFFNILLLTDEGPVFKVMKDTSNTGMLARFICTTMGLPFFRDIEDHWVDKTTTKIDPDKDYYDLLDIEDGYDFKIVKTKTGSNNWDISYEDSIVLKKSQRALTKDELAIYKENVVDLKTYIKYEDDYFKVKSELDRYLGVDTATEDDDEEEIKPIKKLATAVKPKTKAAKVDDDTDMDEMLKDLDDLE